VNGGFLGRGANQRQSSGTDELKWGGCLFNWGGGSWEEQWGGGGDSH